jgi:BlaI family transcriptional regulator, penicillinase repressor
MPKAPAITDAEWNVIKVLWDQTGQWLGAAQIIEPVARDRAIHHRTIRTLLARLVRKGAVETKRDSANAFLYRAKVSRDSVVREESKSFLSRVFDGNAAPALVHLLHQNRDQLSAAELQELRDLLNRKEKP